MTQAIAMRDMLEEGGHHVVGVSVGVPRAGEAVPPFFGDALDPLLGTHISPGFARDRRNEGIRLGRTVWNTLLRYPEMNRSADKLGQRIQAARADLLVNFYDPIASVLSRRLRPRIPLVVVGHQFLLQHPDFRYPAGRRIDQFLFRAFNRFVALGAARRWALSYEPDPGDQRRGIVVIPPILRSELFRQELDRDEGFLLVYLLNAGYLEELMAWHARRDPVPLHCFCKRPGAPESEEVRQNFFVHQLSDRFLDFMARCTAVVCTAGFESLAEALYLGKPAFMIPTAHHYEQFVNAFDAERRGLAKSAEAFDLDPFLASLAQTPSDPASYRTWVLSASDRVLAAVEELPNPTAR